MNILEYVLKNLPKINIIFKVLKMEKNCKHRHGMVTQITTNVTIIIYYRKKVDSFSTYKNKNIVRSKCVNKCTCFIRS